MNILVQFYLVHGDFGNWLGIKVPETPDQRRQNHHQSHHIICSIKKVDESGGIDKNDAYYYINLNRLSRNLDNQKKDNFL